MIIDRLYLCPFCFNKLVKRRSGGSDGWLLDCPNQEQHASTFLWAWYDNVKEPNQVTAVNVRVGRYQLWWGLHAKYKSNTGKFALIDTRSQDADRHEIFTSSDLPDFPLDKEVIENKIKTILTFL